jgi:integrase
MSVRKRKWTTRSGDVKEAWIVDYSYEGQRTLKTFPLKKEADAFAQQVGVDIRAGTHTPVNRSITVAKAAEDWLESVRLDKRERSTLDYYRQHAAHITKHIGKYKLASLTATRGNTFRDELLATMSRPLARKVLTSLRSLLRDAQRRGNVAQNVALSVKRIDADGRGKKKLKIGEDIPSADEIKALIAAMPDNRWRPILLTAIFTGLRSSELRGLRWTDVDIKAGVAEIGEPKSKAGHRTVPLGPMVLNTLREWKLKCPQSELKLAFPTENGLITRYNDIVRALQAAGLRAGLLDANGKPKYTGLHALRHFYASWCINPVDCLLRSCRTGSAIPRS